MPAHSGFGNFDGAPGAVETQPADEGFGDFGNFDDAQQEPSEEGATGFGNFDDEPVVAAPTASLDDPFAELAEPSQEAKREEAVTREETWEPSPQLQQQE